MINGYRIGACFYFGLLFAMVLLPIRRATRYNLVCGICVHMHTHEHVQVIIIHVCACVCACLCVRESELIRAQQVRAVIVYTRVFVSLNLFNTSEQQPNVQNEQGWLHAPSHTDFGSRAAVGCTCSGWARNGSL